jgi:hypothetical protein
MRTKVLLGLAVALMLVVSVATIGSNMGFKISIPLTAPTVTNSGSNWIALPFYNSYTDAASVFADVPGCSQVSRYLPASDSFEDYLGFDLPGVSVNFAIAATDGYAYLVKVSADTNWITVGSHNPSLKLDLYAPTGSTSGSNFVAVPYHSTASDAAALFSQVPTCSQVSRYLSSTDGYEDYLGFELPGVSANFSLTPGVPVLVKVNSDQTGASGWLPAHY